MRLTKILNEDIVSISKLKKIASLLKKLNYLISLSIYYIWILKNNFRLKEASE